MRNTMFLEPLLLPRTFFDLGESFLPTIENSYWKKQSNNYLLKVDIPGIAKGDLKLELIDNLVKISAKNESRNYQFSASIPNDANQETFQAKLENGVLEVSVKVKEKQIKSIEVK